MSPVLNLNWLFIKLNLNLLINRLSVTHGTVTPTIYDVVHNRTMLYNVVQMSYNVVQCRTMSYKCRTMSYNVDVTPGGGTYLNYNYNRSTSYAIMKEVNVLYLVQ